MRGKLSRGVAKCRNDLAARGCSAPSILTTWRGDADLLYQVSQPSFTMTDPCRTWAGKSVQTKPLAKLQYLGCGLWLDHWENQIATRSWLQKCRPYASSCCTSSLEPQVLCTSMVRQISGKRLGDVPQVAMMFLIRQTVHVEDVWRDWLLPTNKVVHPDIECDAEVKKCYKETVVLESARSIYDEQGFFTFYVHAKPGVPAFSKGSVFYEREVKDRIEVRHNTPVTHMWMCISCSLFMTVRPALRHMQVTGLPKTSFYPHTLHGLLLSLPRAKCAPGVRRGVLLSECRA